MTNWVIPSSQKYYCRPMTNWVTPSSQKYYCRPMTNWVTLLAKKFFLQNMNSGYVSHKIISYTIFDFWKALKEVIFITQFSQITDLQGTC